VDYTKPKFHLMSGALVNVDRLLMVAVDKGEALFLFDNGSETRIAQPSISAVFLAELANATGATNYEWISKSDRGVNVPPATAAPPPEVTEVLNQQAAKLRDEALKRQAENPSEWNLGFDSDPRAGTSTDPDKEPE